MRIEAMAAWRQAFELAISEEDLAVLRAIARSRTEPAGRVKRVRMLLAYREDLSFFAVGRTVGVHHQTVKRCVERAMIYGPIAALDDLPTQPKLGSPIYRPTASNSRSRPMFRAVMRPMWAPPRAPGQILIRRVDARK
jgi:hypothetical protein